MMNMSANPKIEDRKSKLETGKSKIEIRRPSFEFRASSFVFPVSSFQFRVSRFSPSVLRRFEFIANSILETGLQQPFVHHFRIHHARGGGIADKNALALASRLQGDHGGCNSHILS